jgi:hypothetical protein
VLALPFHDDPQAAILMANTRKRLEAKEAPVGELAVADYPEATWQFGDDWNVLYVGPFASEQDAEAQCPALEVAPSMCAAFQPGDPAP